ncbi:MAG: M14 family metallocarboxypeptidase [Clostridia bacterium]|nr:M14 family metallocarboxypeptidase [Clostridia bacterium]
MENTVFDSAALLSSLAQITQDRDFIQYDVLTRSILGREIPLITLGKGKKTVLYVGAHHGMEWITAAVLVDFIADYCRQYEKNGAPCGYRMSYMLEKRRILIVPMLNPDGVEYATHGVSSDNPLYARVLSMNGSADFSRWQANARGVDLNHNYDAGFLEYKTREQDAGVLNGAPTRYSGEYPESEPETAALCRLLRFYHEDLLGVLTLHTQGEEIFCSCGDNLSAKTLSVGRMLARMTGYRLAHPAGLAAFGGLTDWCIASLHRPSYTLECGKGENPLPIEQRSLIYEKLRCALFSFPFLI